MPDIYREKWGKFLRRIWPFRFIPFVDFVLVAGSLATGNVKESSDFDVIIGVRQGRIFSARLFCYFVFGILGWRKGKKDKIGKDKFCFNHFVAPKAFRLSPPYNEYWANLYLSLIPVYGDKKLIQNFFDENIDWLGKRRSLADDFVNIQHHKNIFKLFFQTVLSGFVGNWLEKKFKNIQIKRIEEAMNSETGYKPRIIYNDNELEFHPDTRRIEEMLNNSQK
ncbi:MAG: hypothetical protein PHN74_00635 [Candidatus Pacebacteria bacterium]|nr:hypothetical protein [Candidatus Paceibacterota bacterium]